MTIGAPDLPLAAGFDPPTHEAWLALVDKVLKGADREKRLVARSADGLRIEPLYTRDDALPGAATARPGSAPFTRGGGQSRAGWDIRTVISAADPAEANAAVLEDLEGGATSIALNLATPGGSGLASDRATLSRALDGVLLGMCGIALFAGERAPEAAEALLAIWDAKDVADDRRRGHMNADPLGTMAAMGGLGQPLDAAIARAVALVDRTGRMPGVTALLADGNVYHCAGATEAQELAAMLATLVAYLRAAEAAGIAPETALPKIAVGVAADTDQFLTIAKLRAARRLVWRIGEAVGAGSAAGRVHTTAVTAWRMMAKRDPWTNMLRTTIACAAAAMGGADAIVVLPYTYALGKPDRFARRIARNTQLVLQEESSLGRVADPAGGSWYVERLTDDLSHKAWALFQEIEAKGGMAAALGSGFVQGEIAKAAEVREKAVATGRQELTGVSAFPLLADDGVEVEPWDAAVPSPAKVFEVPALAMRRLAEPFERLRDAADAHAARTGRPPQVFVASLGAIVDHNVRTTWIKNYLAAGGIAALVCDGYASAAEAAAAFSASGAAIACIASSDALYAELAEETAAKLKGAGAAHVLMAGRAGDKEARYRDAGVDGFLHAGTDAISVLRALHAQLGIG
jgi:methylmalonyl-CoA mutase